MKKQLLTLAVSAVLTSTVVASAATTFSDVPDNSNYAPYIYDLNQKGILLGNGDGTFGPQDKLTRAQFAVMLTKAFNLPMSTKLPKFTDSQTHWGKFYIESAYEAGIVAGTSDTTFEPDKTLTREQAAAMVWRYISAHGVSASPATNLTGSVDSWAVDAVNNIVGHVFYGPGEVLNTDYRAKDTMTRQEAAALIDTSIKEVNKTPAAFIQQTLVQNSDGTFSTSNLTMPQSFKNAQTASELQANLALFDKAKFSFNGNQVTITLPATGTSKLWWSVEDLSGTSWEGSDAKTLVSTPKKGVGITLFDHDAGHVLVGIGLLYSNGKWSAQTMND